jgi:hypothetical protein
LGAAPECQREALRQIDFFFDLNVFGFDSVADDLSVFNDGNAVIGYHHGSRRILISHPHAV